MRRPLVGITMGDAAGIGPEVIAGALAKTAVYEWCRPLVIGDAEILARALRAAGGPALRVVALPEDGAYAPGEVDCIDLDLLPGDLPYGRLSAAAGDAAFRFIERAVAYARERRIDAICTAPLNKAALHLGGHLYPGHTEILAALTGADEVAMMLATPKLRVVHITTHVGLLRAVELITPERTLGVIRLADEALRRAGSARPRLAVCGINPHAGEGGLFGNGEEEAKLVPAIAEARDLGIEVSGPYPADTLFFRAVRGDFDVVVACYHDQGHGPVKVLGLEAGVNITLGLGCGIVRTSVDHGTAFDIAGQNRADPRSLIEAIRQAALLAPRRP